MNEQEKRQLNELLEWKRQKERQQISFPLDIESQKILSKYFLPIKGYGYLLNATASNDYVVGLAETEINNASVPLTFDIYLKKHYVDTATDTIYSDKHGFVNDQQVYFLAKGSLPYDSTQAVSVAGGLDTVVPLYVISSTTNSFKVSTTIGGSAVDITSTGVGDQYVSGFQ
jgi:hypothetical protein